VKGYWDIRILGYWDIGILGYWDIGEKSKIRYQQSSIVN
jgi:hypothetical protein